MTVLCLLDGKSFHFASSWNGGAQCHPDFAMRFRTPGDAMAWAVARGVHHAEPMIDLSDVHPGEEKRCAQQGVRAIGLLPVVGSEKRVWHIFTPSKDGTYKPGEPLTAAGPPPPNANGVHHGIEEVQGNR